MSLNYKKTNFLLLSILFTSQVIAEIENENVAEANNEKITITRGCCKNPYVIGPRGDRGPAGDSTFPTAYASYFADPGQGTDPEFPLTPTSPLDFSNQAVVPHRLQLTPPDPVTGQSTGIIVEDSGVYIILYGATFIVAQDDTETVGSLAVTTRTSLDNTPVVIDSTIIQYVSPAGTLFTGDAIQVVNSTLINLNSGDIIGLQCPGLQNISSTGLSAQAVVIEVQRIG